MRWENRSTTLRTLLAIAALLAVPHLSSLIGKELLRPLAEPLDRLLAIHRYREVTGYAGLGLVLVAMSVSVRPGRVRLALLRQQSRAVHITVGLLLLVAVLLHTGGTWGAHLNGLLLVGLQLAVFIALAGKWFENRHLESGAGGIAGIRTIWLPAHLLAVALLLVFLVLHLFSVYYF
jgi:hypothetical protein